MILCISRTKSSKWTCLSNNICKVLTFPWSCLNMHLSILWIPIYMYACLVRSLITSEFVCFSFYYVEISLLLPLSINFQRTNHFIRCFRIEHAVPRKIDVLDCTCISFCGTSCKYIYIYILIKRREYIDMFVSLLGFIVSPIISTGA